MLGPLLVLNGIVIQVPGPASISHVLPQHNIFLFDRRNAFEDAVLGVADPVSRRGPVDLGRRLHGHQGQHLHEVILDHIPDDPVVREIPTAALRAEVLLERDPHASNVLRVEQRLEPGVPEAKKGQILYNLLAQIVVDAEDVVFRPDLPQVIHQLLSRRQIMAKRLLHDEPGEARGRRRGGSDGPGGIQEGVRGDGEIEQPVGDVGAGCPGGSLQLLEVGVQPGKVLLRPVAPLEIRAKR
mmetsp:Transcript_5741/g.13964  ORF Transcript_5741/g.13964 Transcript_5741/m.13964 type:complete len:240 (+) Transcript_5741:567-1286(+)